MISRIIRCCNDNEFEETLEEHIAYVYKALELLKHRRIKTLARIIRTYARSIGEDLSEEESMALADKALKYAAIYHDIGKASSKFQTALENRYRSTGVRHEVLSAYIAYFAMGDLPKRLRKAVSRAILLHHQTRTIGKITCNQARYRLTAKLFQALALLSSDRYEETINNLKGEIIVSNREELKEALLEVTRKKDEGEDPKLEIIRDILAFGTGAREKALVDSILAALIEADRLAAMVSSAKRCGYNVTIENRFNAAMISAIDDLMEYTPSFEPVEAKVDIPEAEGEEYVEIPTPGFNPTYDTLRLFGFLDLLNSSEGEVISASGHYIIRVPKDVIEELGRSIGISSEAVWKRRLKHLLRVTYAIFSKMTHLKVKDPLKALEAIVNGDFKNAKVPVYYQLSLHIGGTYIRKPFNWPGKGGELRKMLEKKLQKVLDVLKNYRGDLSYEDLILLSALPYIGFVFYVPKYQVSDSSRIFSYPLVAPGGPWKANALRFSYASSLREFTFRIMSRDKSKGTIDLFGMLLQLSNELAPAIDLDALDFLLVKLDIGQNQATIRGSSYLSASNIWNFFLDILGGKREDEDKQSKTESSSSSQAESEKEEGDKQRKHTSHRFNRAPNMLCMVINNIRNIDFESFSLLGHGLEELNVGYVYDAVRMMVTHKDKGAPYLDRFIYEVKDRIARQTKQFP